MLTIKRAAALTGLSEATLRAWERRYAVVSPHRTESGYRLYDEQQLQVLRAMRDLVGDGWSPREAAAEARASAPASSDEGDAAPETPAVPAREDERAGGREDERAGAREEEQPTGDAASTDELVAAGAAMDEARLATVLDEGFSRGSFEAVARAWLFPALRALGTAWQAGEVTVAGEHLVAGAVQRRLAGAFDAAGRRAGAPRVVVGLPPGGRHELGALAFATAARRAGLDASYLGPDLPEPDWVRAVSGHAARAAVLAVPRADDVAAARAVARRLHREAPGVLVAVGGRRQDAMPAFCVRLGHDVGAGAARLRELVAP